MTKPTPPKPHKTAIGIFDIDGTLADKSLSKEIPPERYYTPNVLIALRTHKNVGAMFVQLTKNPRFEVHVVTGREEKLRQVTYNWLDLNFKVSESPQRVRLHLRPDGVSHNDIWAYKASKALTIARRMGRPEELHIFEDDLETMTHYKRVMLDRVLNLRIHRSENGVLSLWYP